MTVFSELKELMIESTLKPTYYFLKKFVLILHYL